MSKDYPWGKGTVKTTLTTTANSTHAFTVPAGKIWVPLSMIYQVITTATAGDRKITVQVTNVAESHEVYSSPMVTVAASKKMVSHLNFGDGCSTQTLTAATAWMLDGSSAADTDGIMASCPELILPAGYHVYIRDRAAIAAGADDYISYFTYLEYDA